MKVAVRFDAVSRHFGTVRAVESVDSQINHANALVAVPISSKQKEKNWGYDEEAEKVYGNSVFAQPVPNCSLTVFAPSRRVQFAAKYQNANQNGQANSEADNPKHKITDAHSANLMKVSALTLNEPKNDKNGKNARAPLHPLPSRFGPFLWNHYARCNAHADSDEKSKRCQNTLPPTQAHFSQEQKAKSIPEHRTCQTAKGLKAQVMLEASLLLSIFELNCIDTFFDRCNRSLLYPNSGHIL